VSRGSFADILAAPPATAEEAGWRAVADLHHAYFTGLILMLASRAGAATVGDWTFRVFRRQHEEKFLASFDKLGLAGLPPALAAARYHYLSNRIGGVEVEYMPEADDKAWVRFCHPRWLYEGAALCAAPEEVSHGFIKGWYAHNGVSMGEPGLGFVCTSQDMTAQYGFAGYFKDYGRPLADDERLRFAPDEVAPRFDPALAPALDAAAWPPARLRKAQRNYAMDYVRTGLIALVDLLGAEEGGGHGRLAAEIIGRQFYRALQDILGAESETAAGFAAFLATMATAQGDAAEVADDGGHVVVRQTGWRLMRGEAPDPACFDAWSGLWSGCLAVHDRFLALDVVEAPTADRPEMAWRVREAGWGADS
jgi:hypothetical protein